MSLSVQKIIEIKEKLISLIERYLGFVNKQHKSYKSSTLFLANQTVIHLHIDKVTDKFIQFKISFGNKHILFKYYLNFDKFIPSVKYVCNEIYKATMKALSRNLLLSDIGLSNALTMVGWKKDVTPNEFHHYRLRVAQSSALFVVKVVKNVYKTDKVKALKLLCKQALKHATAFKHGVFKLNPLIKLFFDPKETTLCIPYLRRMHFLQIYTKLYFENSMDEDGLINFFFSIVSLAYHDILKLLSKIEGYTPILVNEYISSKSKSCFNSYQDYDLHELKLPAKEGNSKFILHRDFVSCYNMLVNLFKFDPEYYLEFPYGHVYLNDGFYEIIVNPDRYQPDETLSKKWYFNPDSYIEWYRNGPENKEVIV